MKKFFIRDDDVYDKQDGLEFFCDRLLGYGFPLTLALIPDALTFNCISYIQNLQAKYKDIVVIAQHGYKHQNYVQEGKFSEFNSERGFDAIKQDILAGKRILDEHFDFRNKIFVPPWHGFSVEGIKALEELGFSIFSSGSECVYRSEQIQNVNISVDITASYNPEKAKDSDIYLEEILSFAQADDRMLGIMTHHRMLSNQQIIEFTEVLNKLRIKNNIECTSILNAID